MRSANEREDWLDEASILVLKRVILPERALGPIGINVNSYNTKIMEDIWVTMLG